MQKMIAALLILATSLAVGAEQEPFTYLGSFSHSRHSESGHDYIYEFRLWQASGTLHGAFLMVAGLEGGGIPPMAEAIVSGRTSASDKIEIKTRFYSFVGAYNANELKGELRQGSEVLWGGVNGSNAMTLRKGSNIPAIPEKQLKSIKEVNAWVLQLEKR